MFLPVELNRSFDLIPFIMQRGLRVLTLTFVLDMDVRPGADDGQIIAES